MENDDNKVGMVEIVLWLLLFTIPVDAISAILDTTGIGAAIMPFFQAAMMFVIRAWFYFSKHDADAMKINGKQLTRLVSNVLPWIPTVTSVFLVDVFMHNNPKAAQLASATAGGKFDAGKITDIKKTQGTIAAMREARSQYRAAMESSGPEQKSGGDETRKKGGVERKKQEEPIQEYPMAA